MIDKIWKSNNLVNFILLPFSFLYFLIIQIYRIIKYEKNCDVPVICIGNLTVGGAGKTPTVIKIREILSDYYKEVYVLTRGYNGKKSGPILVTNQSSFKDVGEESLLHSKYGSTCVSKNKFYGANFCKAHGSDLIIMDDGLQSVDIKKNCKILVIDENYRFGNHKIFPAGPLREPIYDGLKRCDLVLIMGKKNFLKNFRIVPTSKIFLAKKKLVFKHHINKNVFVFSALGNNDNFHLSLLEHGFKIKSFRKFPDHYIFKNKDLYKIINEAKKKKLNIVCTEKDYVKIPNKFKEFISPIGLIISIKNEQNFKKKILEFIKN